MLLVWALFVLGQLVHLAAQIDAIVHAPNSPAKTHREVIQARWAAIISRLFAATLLFWLFVDGGLAGILRAMGVQVPEWLESLPVTAPVAGFVGLAIDAALSYIPFLRSTIPPPITAENSTEGRD